MDITLALIALFSGVYYWFCSSVWGYTFTDAFFSPVVTAIPLGLLLGDLQTALIIGATIQLIYIGQINTGGNWPADECLAACIVIPLAINTGMQIEVAAALAIPVSFLGVFIRNVLRAINTVFVHWADKFAIEGNVRGISRCAFAYPMLTGFVFRVPPVFIVNYFGADLINPILAAIPEFIMHAFEVAGGVLPALGIAMTVMLIGKKNNFALFFLAFFVVKYFEMDIMLSAFIGLSIAFLMVFNVKREGTSA